jgi:diguanylate cyclase (GGDEF)-like protein/PAS domain S-box-containing protein
VIFQISPYSLTFLVTVVISSIAAGIAWRRRQAPGGFYLFVMMLAVVEWNLADFMEASYLQLAEKIIWSKIGYLGTHTTPALFLLFSLAYTGRKHILTRRNIALFFLVPIVTILLAATNEWHHLIWTGFTPGPPGSTIYIYGHGAWFWIATIYINCILFFGTFILLRFALRSKELYLYQALAIIMAVLFPWISFVIYLSGLNPFPGLDLTAISFGITGSILVFILLRWRFLDVIPVARETLVEELADGVFVLDAQNRIVDINMSARRLLCLEDARLIGQRVDEALAGWPYITRSLAIKASPVVDGNLENVVTIHAPEVKHFDIHVTSLQLPGGKMTGRLIVLRDITSRIQAEVALRQSNQALLEKLTEIEALQSQMREQSIRDPLTGLFNRRFLKETLDGEQARALRRNYSISILMIDVDLFKQINDENGHEAGDTVLVALSDFLLSMIRQGDIVCRYGGDEFLVVLPGIGLEDVRYRAEALCQGFDAMFVKFAELELHATISIGVAVYPQQAGSLNEVIQAADSAMYEAKRAGRNRVCVWNSTISE